MDNNSPSRPTRRPRSRSGQAMLESAFVLPFFLMLVFAFVQLGLWGYGRFQGGEAARVGVHAMNEQLSRVSADMAADSRLIANYLLVPADVRNQVVPACRRVLNINALNRGWNGNNCVSGLPNASGPLSAGMNAARNHMTATGASKMFGSVAIRACYLDVSGAFINCGGGSLNPAGPAFVMVEVSGNNPGLIFFPQFNPGSFTVRQYSAAQRYMAACPIDRDPNCMRVNGYTR